MLSLYTARVNNIKNYNFLGITMSEFGSEIFLGYLLVGSVAGTLSGLFGIGGGIVLVPVLSWLFSLQDFPNQHVMIMAVATSLATIVFTSISSARAHHRQGAVLWKIVWKLTPGLMLGSIVGSLLADLMPANLLKTIFALFLIAVTIQMWTQSNPPIDVVDQHQHPFFAAGGVIGLLSAILGIGGGTLTVPFLMKCRYSIRNAVAVSSACGFPIASLGALTYIYLGWVKQHLPDNSLGYVYLPALIGVVAASFLFAPIGAKLTHKLPTQQLKRYFALFICMVGLKMLW